MDVYMGMIFPVAFSFAPIDFMPCDGRILQVNQYQALYSLLGNAYGGTASTTFGIPDLRGRVPLGAGTPAISPTINFPMGQKGGAISNSMVISQAQLPAHTHTATFIGTGGGQSSQPTINVTSSLKVSSQAATESVAGTNNANSLGAFVFNDPNLGAQPSYGYVADNSPAIPLQGLSVTATATGGSGGGITGGSVSVGVTGSSQPLTFSILPPYTVVYYIMAVVGLYPTRQ